jgi:hypothetical protein
MANIAPTGSERRAESFGARRFSHLEKTTRGFRFAGELFQTAERERSRRQDREARRKLSSSEPVGVGFGERDNYGPDESWDTADPIKYTPVPEYYTSYRSSAPQFGRPQ